MTNDPSSSASSELVRQLIAILGLPERIEKLSLHFVANEPVVADVRYWPNINGPLAVDARFKCVPLIEGAPDVTTADQPVGQGVANA